MSTPDTVRYAADPASTPRKVALVTGAGRGIGAGLARALAGDGFALGLLGRRRHHLDGVAETLPGESVAVTADVTDPDAVQAAVHDVRAALGPIDVLVNNAGVRDRVSTKPWEADADDWWHVLDVNVRGVMLVTSAVLPGMLERGSGRIIDVGSGVGLRAEPRYSAYSVSKAAAMRWMDNVATGLGEDSPVRVVTASPGLIETDMTESMWEPDDNLEFGSLEPMLTFVRRFAAGELDHLHGRYVHTVKDHYEADSPA